MSFLDQRQLNHLEDVKAAFHEKYGIMFKINFVANPNPQKWIQTLKVFVKNMDTDEVINNSVTHDFSMKFSLNPDFFAIVVEKLMVPIFKQCDEWANIKKNIDLIKGL